jgi:PhnB protein
MSIQSLSPYIHLNRTAEEAIRLYESALGAKIANLMRYRDAPPGMNMPAEAADLIMHSELRIGEGAVMVSDAMPGRPASAESNIQIALNFTQLDGMASAFDALADGGAVIMPLHDAFWGAKFGIVTDRYGVQWLFNCELKQA